MQITSLAASRFSLAASILLYAILHSAERGSKLFSKASSAIVGSGAGDSAFDTWRCETWIRADTGLVKELGPLSRDDAHPSRDSAIKISTAARIVTVGPRFKRQAKRVSATLEWHRMVSELLKWLRIALPRSPLSGSGHAGGAHHAGATHQLGNKGEATFQPP